LASTEDILFDGPTVITGDCRYADFGSFTISDDFTMTGGTLWNSGPGEILTVSSGVLNLTDVNISELNVTISSGVTGVVSDSWFNKDVHDNSGLAATSWCVNDVGNNYTNGAVYYGLNDGTCVIGAFSIDTVTCTATAPIEASSTVFPVVANYTDGGETVTQASAEVNLSATTSDVSCTIFASYVTCDVPMQYYDPAGIYDLNVTLNHTGGSESDLSQTCEYYELTASGQSANVLSFPFSGPGDSVSANVVINNTGNAAFDVFITSYDLTGDTLTSETLTADNFYASLSSSGTNPISMVDSTSVNVTMQLTPQQSSTLYLFVDLPQDLFPQIYIANTPWLVSLQ